MKVLGKAATEQAVDVKEQTAGFDILCKKSQNVKKNVCCGREMSP